jgi:ABC-type antimicrobial peptide transport system permease subunit
MTDFRDIRISYLATTMMLSGMRGHSQSRTMLRGLLYDVSATDPTNFVVVALLLGAVRPIGAYLPARRAARIDPIVALREE